MADINAHVLPEMQPEVVKKMYDLYGFKLAAHLVAREDSARFYPLCATCDEKVETIGDPPPAEELVFAV